MRKLLLILFVALLSVSLFGQDFSITIDGERDAWYNTLTGPDSGYIFIPFEAVDDGASMPDDDADLSALVWCAWDETYLYFYFEVWDLDILVNNATNYNNDAVELKMDLDPYSANTQADPICAVRMTALDEDEADEPAGVDNICSTSSEIDWANADTPPVAGEDYARNTDRNAEGYNIEFRIPWEYNTFKDEAVTVAVNSEFGLGINIMDNDETTRTETLRWCAVMNDLIWNNPAYEGSAIFHPNHKIELLAENHAEEGDGAYNENAETWYIPPAPTTVDEILNSIPTEFALIQNYPNPFNPTTTVKYVLNQTETVSMTVYNLNGQIIKTLVPAVRQEAGEHQVVWNATDNSGNAVSSGVYLCRLNAGTNVQSIKMLLTK